MTREQVLRLIDENLQNSISSSKTRAEKILTELEIQGLISTYPIDESMKGKTQAVFVLGMMGPHRLVPRPSLEPMKNPDAGFALRYPIEDANAEVRLPITVATIDNTKAGIEELRKDLHKHVDMVIDDYLKYVVTEDEKPK